MKCRSFLNRFLTYTVLAALAGAAGCGSSPAGEAEAAAPQSPYYSGSGGQGISLAILELQATGLSEDLNYLPTLVQGELVSNFNTYSAISILDRVRLEEMYELDNSGYLDDKVETDLGHLDDTTHLLNGSITKTATGYALQISITKNEGKTMVASYSGTCTAAEMDNLTGVKRASLGLLKQMGVAVTPQTERELSGAGS